MRYFLVSCADGSEKEVSRTEAHEWLSKWYDESRCECSFDDLLSTVGELPSMFRVLEVRAD